MAAQAAFFSYAREDSGFALRLATDLRSSGVTVWLDQIDILPGQRWDRAVEDALAGAPIMLVVLSPSSVESANVQDEVAFALDEGKTIIPLLHRDCTIPFRLRRFQHIDLRNDYDRGLKSLVGVLGAKPSHGTESSVESKAPAPEVPPRRIPAEPEPDAPDRGTREANASASPVPRQQAQRSRTMVAWGLILFLAAFGGFAWIMSLQGRANRRDSAKVPSSDSLLASDPVVSQDNQQSTPDRGSASTSTEDILTDTRTGLMWTRKDNGSAIGWNDANAYCEELTLGGFDDWYLPTSDQLSGIYDPNNVTGHDAHWDIHTIPGFHLGESVIWSSKNASQSAGFFRFSDGERLRVREDNIGAYNLPCLCVRDSR